MTTRTEIANRALGAIASRATIVDINENSTEAKQARLYYDTTRDAMLRGAHWNFARRTIALTLLKSQPGTPTNLTGSGPWNPATMPPPPWLYEYAYPSDCVLMRSVILPPTNYQDISPPLFSTPLTGPVPNPPSRPSPFVIGSDLDANGAPINVVLTNVQSALACYTARLEVEDMWDAAFQEAMAFALGSRLAMALTGNIETAKIAAQQAMSALVTARARDGNEGTTTVDSIPDWILARGYAPTTGWYGNVVPWITPPFLVL